MQGHDPFQQMEELFDQMRRSTFGSWATDGRRSLAGGRAVNGRPAVGGEVDLTDGPGSDVSVTLEERDDAAVVLVDLPGFESTEIELTFDDAVLTIEATHEDVEDEAYRNRHVYESIRIPREILLDDATATYNNGVLEVVLPFESRNTDDHRIDIE